VTSSNIKSAQPCPLCGGVGFIRRDLLVTDPNFGKLDVCSCQQQDILQARTEQLYRVSNLDAFRNLTFETFNARGRLGLADQQMASLDFARSQAEQFAASPQGWLLLMGGYGCGKTHLAAAVANRVVASGIPVLFLTVPDVLDWLRTSYGSNDIRFEDRFEEIRNIPLLVLDDLGTQNATPWAEEKLYQIINHRYVHRIPMVVTTNLDLVELDGRIRSRLKDPDLTTIVRITSPDYRSPVQEAGATEISSLALVSDHTFGNFSMRENESLPPEEFHSLEKAFQAASKFSEDPRGWLVFTGTYGCGKTHLAAAIGNYRSGMGEDPIFQVVPDLLDHLRATFNPNSAITYDHLFEQVRTVRLLILDDLGTQSATPWAREKLYQILNYRYEGKLPTVITTSFKVDELDPRIRSRMADSRLCKINGIMVPSYRGGVIPAGNARAKNRKSNLTQDFKL
jgi:DNA replication protein DnaC